MGFHARCEKPTDLVRSNPVAASDATL